jgi:hypothetical protein
MRSLVVTGHVSDVRAVCFEHEGEPTTRRRRPRPNFRRQVAATHGRSLFYAGQRRTHRPEFFRHLAVAPSIVCRSSRTSSIMGATAPIA